MLVCGHPPFQEANDSETLSMILDCCYVVPPGLSSPCADLIAQMLQRDPKQRASLEQIESHPWLRGVDPSPASRHRLPLTSHRRVSEEEHEIILRAMMCGHIADREAIQEALEANRYNHVTATYFLLAERILREKQVLQVSNRSQSRCPLDHLSPLPPPAGGGSLLPAPAKDALGDSFAGRPLPSFSVLQEGKAFHALLQPPLTETTVAKSTLALQQISEEDEEVDEEAKPSLFRRRSSSLNQEQMNHFQSTKLSSLLCRGLTAHYGMGKSLLPGQAKPLSLEPGPETEPRGCRALQAEDTLANLRLPGPPAEVGPQRSSKGGGNGRAVGGLGGWEVKSSSPPGRVPAEKEMDSLSSSTSSPGRGGQAEQLSEGLEARPPRGPQACGGRQSIGKGQEGLVEGVVRHDPAKGRDANLKERLLHFPLSEKPLAFRMPPASKGDLLSLGPFSCCHLV